MARWSRNKRNKYPVVVHLLYGDPDRAAVERNRLLEMGMFPIEGSFRSVEQLYMLVGEGSYILTITDFQLEMLPFVIRMFASKNLIPHML